MVAVVKPRLEIRAMARSDLDAVMEIEIDAYDFPWTRGIFSDCLRVGYCCRVILVDDAVGGYAVISMGAGEAHLLNLCIAECQRGNGLGRLMLEHLVDETRVAGMQRLFLEVRPSNHVAIGLYQSNGFKVIGRRPAYYPTFEGREDAMVMVYRIP